MLGKYDHPVDDTSDPMTDAIYRRMPGMERLRVAFGMQEFAARVLEARVRNQFPEWDDAQVLHEVARRILHADN